LSCLHWIDLSLHLRQQFLFQFPEKPFFNNKNRLLRHIATPDPPDIRLKLPIRRQYFGGACPMDKPHRVAMFGDGKTTGVFKGKGGNATWLM
jgi:hypothetical protein